jgi:peptidoglycan hydrolase-like protein with peptidoglycan-binding domain
MQGDDVRLLQQRLLDLGYRELEIADGIFGPKTDQAVRRFQTVNGLVVDGRVGRNTWDRLFSDKALASP